jgi:hypothetical protein
LLGCLLAAGRAARDPQDTASVLFARDHRDAFPVDALYISTFFGGSDASWAPHQDET